MHASPALFRLTDVAIRVAGRSVLESVTLEIPRGQFVALVGPSGAGKTRLLRLLNRLDAPASGRIEFDGAAIETVPIRQLRRRIGFAFQTAVMFSGTVADNLSIARDLKISATKEPTPDFAQLLTSVGLAGDYLLRPADKLSGGEKQRVALARALVACPEVLLLDEPTAALEFELADRLVDMLDGLRTSLNLSIVMVTHRMNEVQARATRLLRCEGQRVECIDNTRSAR